MSLRRTDLITIKIASLAAAMALVAAPSAAAEEEAEAVVPPDNSAVNQYTETYPTGGGERDVHKGNKGKASPNHVLGSRNTEKLEKHGKEGRAVAEVAAETAPSVDENAAPPPPADKETDDETAVAGGGKDGGAGRGGADEVRPEQPEPAPKRVAEAEKVDLPDGSSGISEVLAQATGSTSSGELGILLPLVILASLGWAIAALVRRPRRAAR